MTARKRVLIIGLDGFNWTLGRNLMAEGMMPCLSQMVENGCHGNLQSVMPYETAPAWTSFQTGCRPGKTGVYAFHTYDRKLNRIRLSSFADIAVPTLWELADRAGKRVVSLNMPVSHPAPKVNGVIIPGLLCPELSATNCHPPQVYDRYIKPRKDYVIIKRIRKTHMVELVEQSIRTEQVRSEVALELMKDIDWDIFCMQMQSTDTLQHELWDVMQSDGSDSDAEDRARAFSFYRCCDDIIGQLIHAAGDDVLTLIVSDHGFCGGPCSVGLNVWLRQRGYLHLLDKKPATRWDAVKAKTPPLKVMAHGYGRFRDALAGLQRRIRQKLAGGGRPVLFYANQLVHLRRIIDLSTTKAFCLGGMGGMLYVNAPADESAQLQERLTSELLDDLGPSSSNPIVESIRPAAEVYGEDRVRNSSPDLVVRYRPGYESRINPVGNTVVMDKGVEGTHSPDGVFVVQGECVAKGLKLDADIVDMCPTVLAYLGLAVGRHMDGKVLEKVFTRSLDVRYEDVAIVGHESVQYSDVEQAEVEKHLTDLGYL